MTTSAPPLSKGSNGRGLSKQRSARAFQAAFFRQMGLSQQFRLLFDALPDVHFFAKDLDHRFIAASPEVVRRLGARTEEDLLGRRDRDFLPPQLCANIEADDCRLFATGKPLLNRLEIWFDKARVRDWFLTSKFPIRDEAGNVIGVMGFVRPYEGKEGRRQLWSGGTGLTRAIEHIRHHIGQTLNVGDLAARAGLSPRQLHRKFIEAFGVGAQEFIIRTRVQTAGQMLSAGEKNVAQIALDCGFCDQSALTRQFRKQLGITPAAFQKQQFAEERADWRQNLSDAAKTKRRR